MNNALKRTEWAFHAGGVTAVAALVGAAAWFVYRPLETARSQAEGRCAEIAELLPSADRLRAELAELKQTLADARQKEEALLARVPSAAHEAEFLGQISHLAKDVELELRDYRPGQVQPHAMCSAMEVALTCAGNYESLCRFLAGLGQLPRLVNVSRLDIDRSSGAGDFTAQLKLVIYFGAEQQTAAAEGGGGHA